MVDAPAVQEPGSPQPGSPQPGSPQPGPAGLGAATAAIERLLRDGGALVVTGEPGSGRTSLLRWAAAWAAPAVWVPGHADEICVQRLLARRAALCLVDDAHLLDPGSWRLIKRFARRFADAPAAVLAAAPVGFDAGLPILPLSPLDEHAAHELLLRLAPDLADPVAAGLIRQAGGNPAALTALATALDLAQRRGFAPLPEGLPPGSVLGQHLRASLRALPPATRDALLLPALDDRARPAPDALEPAEAAGLISVAPTGEVRFVPAILRDVIRQDAPSIARRRAHLTLARTLRGLPALLHRAAATPGPDPALSRDLGAAAASAAPAQAAIAFRYAAALSDDPAPLLSAARSFWLAGRPDEAVPLARRLSAHHRARSLIAEIGLRGDPLPARDVLLDVAAELIPADTPGALSALLLAGEACCRAGDPGRFPALVSRLEVTDPSPALALAHRQVLGVAALLRGQHDESFAHFRSVLSVAPRVDDPALLVAAAMAGIMVGQDRHGASLAARAAALAFAAGAHALVPAALEAVAYAELAAGRYDAATTAALDGAAAARRYGRLDLADSLLALLAVLAGLVGDRPTGERRCREATARHPEARDLTEWAHALLDLVEGRPAPAAERLAAIVAAPPGRGSAVLRVAVIPHLVEAARAAAPLEPAVLDPAMAMFDRWAGRTGEAPWLAIRARCRALRADEPAADDYFREALRRHDAGFARAHTELLYGRHLRRRRRHLEARTHLRQAAETFHRLDADPWAALAARELRAAGERASASVPVAPGPPLTAQQERIAGLVAAGATNREVAQQLHLSTRTVDHHLRNVFARLGVRSRTELARVLHE
ncbi:LuxR C-terminal-related transcriptional regulator [Paractinoplanes rhizophilus]|uniref:LuxR C-terminal-related transcriptional regulator n=1 Tax=Paractinoplanes rhizophilus TaxID=1416877 RepID=A0ABW2HPK4_9ACTN